MKELTIEEKAKAYDEAKARMSRAWNDKKCTLGFMNEIFPELKESEDERISNALINFLKEGVNGHPHTWIYSIDVNDVIDWLKKQCEHANFRNKIQIGDKVTRNDNGELVNLSQLQRVAKPCDKVEPKFKIGDYVKDVNDKREPIYEIVYMDKECYICEYRGKENIGDKAVMHFAFDNPYLRLVEQNPAWSEEDEKMVKCCEIALEAFEKLGKNTQGFPHENYFELDKKIYPSEVNRWFKSLKERCTWKPSDEQMEALEKECIAHSNYELCRLLEQLKKLRME